MNQKGKTLLFTFGRLFSPFYSQLMRVRAFCYQKNIIKTHELAVPVISVGNLTMGGTGKTPLVIYIAALLKQQGYRPAVVSRGYRAKSRNPVNIVSDGKTILMDPISSGDEPWLIANSLPDIVVATGRKRILPCQAAIESFGCDVIILDDGFQHMSVSRSLDLVLFDAGFFAGNSRVFPGGDLREPVSSLHRCDAFILTGVNSTNKIRADQCSKLLSNKFHHKPVIQLSKIYSNILKLTPSRTGYSTESIPLEKIPQDLFCFCGIAHPERFEESIFEIGVTPTGIKYFKDHHAYTESVMKSLCHRATDTGASGLLTTEKDMTKIQGLRPCSLPLFILPLKITPNDILDNLILDRMQGKNTL